MTADSSNGAGVVVEHLAKSFPTREGELVILRDVNLDLAGGDGVAITGPSGSGKSTLLHILGGLDRPTAGSVRIAGDDPSAMNETELARFRNTTIGFIFQDHHLLPQCSVLENVLIPTLAGNGATQEAQERAKALIDRVGLSPRITHRPAELSGGERQRVAIARALINQPTLVLCDEPTGNLDRKSADTVSRLLLELFEDAGAALVAVTHSVELAARLPAWYELNDGALERHD